MECARRGVLLFICKSSFQIFGNGNQTVQLLVIEPLCGFQQFPRFYRVGTANIKEFHRGNTQEITYIEKDSHSGETDTCLDIIDIAGALPDG